MTKEAGGPQGGRPGAGGHAGSTRKRRNKPAALLEQLRGAPQKVVKFLSEAPVACVNHALTFVKSFLSEAQLEIFAQGMAADCTEDQFDKYLQEAQPVAEQIVQSVLQD
jgi:hypothetical protein